MCRCLGQNLLPGSYIGEGFFVIMVCTMGLILLASIVGDMQRYFLSTTARLEEWRVNRLDMEQWMHHRRLPLELRESIRKYDQSKWVVTRGVDEEALLNAFPPDLRRDIKRHLCYDLIRRVPLFDQMDERMLDAVCERFKPVLRTQGTCLVREGDPVEKMLFIIRGNLESSTTNGGHPGYFNSHRIGPGDFCGEELLTWALDSHSSVILPSSTRTIKAISEVEGFAFMADDLKLVVSQFRRLHGKQLRHKLRFYSHQWRSWAACFIQAAWRRYKSRKSAVEVEVGENPWTTELEASDGELDENVPSSPSSRLAMYASMLVARTGSGRGVNMHSGSNSDILSPMQKPVEHDFFERQE